MTDHVATLISGGLGDLEESLVVHYAALLRSHGGNDVRYQWLRRGKSVDVFCSDLDVETLREHFRIAIPAQAFDIIVQPVANRRKRLLIADMESTMIEQEMLDEIAALLGLHDKVAKITFRAMNGELDFAASLRQRVELLAGQPVSLLEEAARCITPMRGAAALVATMKRHGAQCWLVTGGFSCFANSVGERLGFDKVFSNHLEIESGKITGRLGLPILDKNSKKASLEQACRDQGLTLADCLAIGDGANDVPMLQACNEGGGLGVAYHAKPVVRAVVPHQINYADLSALIEAQGLG